MGTKSKNYRQFAAVLGVFCLLTPVAAGNIVGSGTQNFHSTASAYDYVTVYSSRTIGAGNFHLNLFLNTAVNTLPYFDSAKSESVNASRGSYNDSVTTMEGSIGYGVLNNWDIGINVPAVLFQDIRNSSNAHGEYAYQGVTDLRVSSKVGLMRTSLWGLAAVASVNVNTTQDNPYDGKNPGPGLNAELVGDIQLGAVELAGNLGYRLHSSGEALREDSPIEPNPNQIIASAAIAYMIGAWNTKWITEIFTSSPTSRTKDDSDRHTTRAEMITGLKIFSRDNLYYHVGLGSELRHSVASADWRGYGGVNYIIGNQAKPRAAKLRPARRSFAQEQPARQPDEIIVVRDIHFKFDSAVMTNPAKSSQILKEMAQVLRQSRLEQVVIEGHTCSLGTDAYNRNLSQKRANRIRSILINEYGFASHQIKAVGLGESLPVASNSTDAGRRQNRRVEFKIYRDLLAE